jgi:dephospho-CoA kinase
MYAVGLTGGIGSGKTLAAKIFSALGIAVFCADDETKKCYDTDDALRSKLKALLGAGIYDGAQLQRKTMAARIFSDPRLLQKVNELVHPIVADRFVRYAAQQSSPYVVMEAAVLFESGLQRGMRKTVTVEAPETLRLQRVMVRDGSTEADVRRRMQHQWSDEQRAAVADYTVVNDDRQALLPQLLAVHEKIKQAVRDETGALVQ